MLKKQLYAITSQHSMMSKIGLYRFVLLVFLLCSVFSVSAQRYSFHNLNVDAGVIQSQATGITQDSIGNLWISTLGGITRYDGKTCTNYNVRNGLPSNTVYAIAVDKNHNIWVGTRKGLACFNGQVFRSYPFKVPADRTINTTQQVVVVNDTVWWRAQGDLGFVVKGKLLYPNYPLPSKPVTCFYAESGLLIIVKNDSVFRLQGNKWDTLKYISADGSKAPGINRFYRDKSGMLWVATNAGLYQLQGNTIQPFIFRDKPFNYPPVLSMVQDRKGALWLGTNIGVVKLTSTSFEWYNKQNGLCDNSFSDMLADLEGNIWMASDGQGVFRFSGTLFTGLDERMGLTSSQVMAIASNRRDSLYLGTYDAGLFVFSNGKVTKKYFPSTTDPSITSLCYSHKNKLWIATRSNGLFILDKGIFRQFTAPDRGFPSNIIGRLYEDPKHRMWIGFSNGVIVYENDSFKTPSIPVCQALSFLQIGEDSLLIATDKNGLLLYSKGTTTTFTTKTLVDSAQIICFTKLGSILWLGTTDNGLLRYDMSSGKLIVVNKKNGLRSDFIYNIIDDADGGVLVGTGLGIHKVSMDKALRPHVVFYGKEQGVTGLESNNNAVLKLGDGSIWFGTTNGAFHYQPNSVMVSTQPKTIVLQSVKLVGESGIDSTYYDSLDKWYGIPYNLMLPYKKNNINFVFQAVSLSGAGQVLYRYKLEGLDAPWSEWADVNSITYSALPPGKYKLHVQCMGSEGAHCPELVYAFEIITPFHKTRWFSLLVLVACVFTGTLIQYTYNRKKQRREKLRDKLRAEEQAKVRMRTAEDFHDEIGNKLTRINVLTNVLKSKISPASPDVSRILEQIEDNVGQLYGGTRDILWSLKPSNDNLYEIMQRMSDFGTELFSETDIQFEFLGIEERLRSYRLPMDKSRNFIMIIKEALNNALKYAQPHHVSIEAKFVSREVMKVLIKDDGKGFDPKAVTRGNGVNNMHVRAERMGGRLYLDAKAGKGTIITLTFKIPRNK